MRPSRYKHGASAAELRRRLEPLVRKTQPYAKRVAHKGIWVAPKLLAEIEYRAKSAEGKVGTRFSRAYGKTCSGETNDFLEIDTVEG
jgi:ATP-dependent DNA ligase